MSTRTTTQHDGITETVTTNGVTTRTAAVMALAVGERTYDTYHPGSGINRELMLAVRDQITADRRWWNQGVWRQLVDEFNIEDLPNDDDRNYYYEDEEKRAIIEAAIAFDIDENVTTACGTAMCFAGWAAEIARVDWVVDAAALKARGEGEFFDTTTSDVLFVPKAWFTEHADKYGNGPMDHGWGYVGTSGSFLFKHAAKRGFTPETHGITAAMTYAAVALGTYEGNDPYNLFDGDNSFERVSAIATVYATLEVPPSTLSYDEQDRLLALTAASLGYDPEDVFGPRDDDEDPDSDNDDED